MSYSRLGQPGRVQECYAKAMGSWYNHPPGFYAICQQELEVLKAEAEEAMGRSTAK